LGFVPGSRLFGAGTNGGRLIPAIFVHFFLIRTVGREKKKRRQARKIRKRDIARQTDHADGATAPFCHFTAFFFDSVFFFGFLRKLSYVFAVLSGLFSGKRAGAEAEREGNMKKDLQIYDMWYNKDTWFGNVR
jgi:hypothetical protein